MNMNQQPTRVRSNSPSIGNAADLLEQKDHVRVETESNVDNVPSPNSVAHSLLPLLQIFPCVTNTLTPNGNSRSSKQSICIFKSIDIFLPDIPDIIFYTSLCESCLLFIFSILSMIFEYDYYKNNNNNTFKLYDLFNSRNTEIGSIFFICFVMKLIIMNHSCNLSLCQENMASAILYHKYGSSLYTGLIGDICLQAAFCIILACLFNEYEKKYGDLRLLVLTFGIFVFVVCVIVEMWIVLVLKSKYFPSFSKILQRGSKNRLKQNNNVDSSIMPNASISNSNNNNNNNSSNSSNEKIYDKTHSYHVNHFSFYIKPSDSFLSVAVAFKPVILFIYIICVLFVISFILIASYFYQQPQYFSGVMIGCAVILYSPGFYFLSKLSSIPDILSLNDYDTSNNNNNNNNNNSNRKELEQNIIARYHEVVINCQHCLSGYYFVQLPVSIWLCLNFKFHDKPIESILLLFFVCIISWICIYYCLILLREYCLLISYIDWTESVQLCDISDTKFNTIKSILFDIMDSEDNNIRHRSSTVGDGSTANNQSTAPDSSLIANSGSSSNNSSTNNNNNNNTNSTQQESENDSRKRRKRVRKRSRASLQARRINGLRQCEWFETFWSQRKKQEKKNDQSFQKQNLYLRLTNEVDDAHGDFLMLFIDISNFDFINDTFGFTTSIAGDNNSNNNSNNNNNNNIGGWAVNQTVRNLLRLEYNLQYNKSIWVKNKKNIQNGNKNGGVINSSSNDILELDYGLQDIYQIGKSTLLVVPNNDKFAKNKQNTKYGYLPYLQHVENELEISIPFANYKVKMLYSKHELETVENGSYWTQIEADRLDATYFTIATTNGRTAQASKAEIGIIGNVYDDLVLDELNKQENTTNLGYYHLNNSVSILFDKNNEQFRDFNKKNKQHSSGARNKIKQNGCNCNCNCNCDWIMVRLLVKIAFLFEQFKEWLDCPKTGNNNSNFQNSNSLHKCTVISLEIDKIESIKSEIKNGIRELHPQYLKIRNWATDEIVKEITTRIMKCILECIEEITKQNNTFNETSIILSDINYGVIHRANGDKFVIKAPNVQIGINTCHLIEKKLKTDKILENYKEKYNISSNISLSMAIGGCLKNADLALNAAKSNGIIGKIVANVPNSMKFLLLKNIFDFGFNFGLGLSFTNNSTTPIKFIEIIPGNATQDCFKILKLSELTSFADKLVFTFVTLLIKLPVAALIVDFVVECVSSILTKEEAFVLFMFGVAIWYVRMKQKKKQTIKEKQDRTYEYGYKKIGQRYVKLFDIWPMLPIEPKWIYGNQDDLSF